MRGLALWVPSGDAGTSATLQHMRILAREGGVTPLVRQVASRLVLGVLRLQHPRVLRDWIGSNTSFLPDPTHAEALHHPGWVLHEILTNGIAQVDCDDIATVAAAMGLSIGLKARFVVVGFHSPHTPYSHVWTELSDSMGRWWAVDPTRPVQGLAHLPIARRWVVEV